MYVYIHTSPTGKRYVGITSQNPERRWGNCGVGYKLQTRFWRAIQKYGWENFQHEIVAEDLDIDSACILEQELIKRYSSNNPSFGYNIDGGGIKNKIVSAETRAKQSATRKGVPTNRHTPVSEETRKKISASRKGKLVGADNPMFGKKLSKEAREKISASQIGKKRGPRPPISEETRRKLSESHKGIPSKNKGKHFKQSDEVIRKKALGHMKKVVCVESGVVYRSSKDASIELGIDSSTITACCKGRRKSAGGYTWEYYNAV